MKAKKLLKCVRKNIKVKMTDEYFNANYDDMPNEFTIYQIEDSCVNLHNEEKAEVFHDIPYKAIEILPIPKKPKKLIFTDSNNRTLFKGTKKELVQLLIDTKEIAECIQIDIDSDNIEDDDRFAFDIYKEFAEKYNK